MSDERQVDSPLVLAQRAIEADRQARVERSARSFEAWARQNEATERTRLDVSIVLRNGQAPTVQVAFVPQD